LVVAGFTGGFAVGFSLIAAFAGGVGFTGLAAAFTAGLVTGLLSLAGFFTADFFTAAVFTAVGRVAAALAAGRAAGFFAGLAGLEGFLE
jgi:hypothetical protein